MTVIQDVMKNAFVLPLSPQTQSRDDDLISGVWLFWIFVILFDDYVWKNSEIKFWFSEIYIPEILLDEKIYK